MTTDTTESADAAASASPTSWDAWLAEDPDPATRVELGILAKAAATGDEAARADLADRFGSRLRFGTAGLRGEMGAGPNRMNRVTVIRAAAGLAAYLTERHGPGAVVAVGFDARHNSHQFAIDTAEVLVGAGHVARLLPRALPTPVLAFSVLHLAAQAGVMVTASHNPARDNGYKVYLEDGSQLAPPHDNLIAAKIDAVGPLASIPRGEPGQLLADDVVAAYLDAARRQITAGTARDVRIVYTPMHGVGWETFRAAFVSAGFPEPLVVAEQAQPDPNFPTVPFPNPEEVGALDLAMALASVSSVSPVSSVSSVSSMSAMSAVQAGPIDVILANDPDADRLAVAVPDGNGGWRQLSGNDVGLLLGRYLTPGAGVFATTIVSSEGLGAIAADRGVGCARTLTGFKWVSKVEGLRYGYEEAIGYCCDPEHVNDKDGITAALNVAAMTASLKARGITLLDGLAEVDKITGNRVSAQVSIRTADAGRIQELMRQLRTSAPATLGGVAVLGAEDLSVDGRSLPLEQGLRLVLGGGWIAVRPSGTEPKLKCYVELGDPTATTREPVVVRLAEVKRELEAWFAERSVREGPTTVTSTRL